MSSSLLQWTPVQRTLAIPLAGRAVAASRFPELGFSDPEAARLFAGMPAEWREPLLRDRITLRGSVVRAALFDDEARRFLKTRPTASVLSLGAGFCTRAERLGAEFPLSRWIDVDFPGVLAAKAELMPDRRASAAPGSLADGEFVSECLRRMGSGPALVLAEGVLMFLETADRDRLLSLLAASLAPGSRLVFDYIHPWVRLLSRRHPSLKVTGATYRSVFGRLERELPAVAKGLVVSEPRLFSKLHRGGTRLLDGALRLVAGGSIYDVARAEVAS